MKKIFPFQVPGRDDARVLEAIKGDVRKYLKRERRKKFPEGFDLWDFTCKLGADQATATATPVAELIPALDRLAASGAKQAYVEILAVPSNRPPRPGAFSSENSVPPETPSA